MKAMPKENLPDLYMLLKCLNLAFMYQLSHFYNYKFLFHPSHPFSLSLKVFSFTSIHEQIQISYVIHKFKSSINSHMTSSMPCT